MPNKPFSCFGIKKEVLLKSFLFYFYPFIDRIFLIFETMSLNHKDANIVSSVADTMKTVR